jgi:hypothetical protein
MRTSVVPRSRNWGGDQRTYPTADSSPRSTTAQAKTKLRGFPAEAPVSVGGIGGTAKADPRGRLQRTMASD